MISVPWPRFLTKPTFPAYLQMYWYGKHGGQVVILLLSLFFNMCTTRFKFLRFATFRRMTFQMPMTEHEQNGQVGIAYYSWLRALKPHPRDLFNWGISETLATVQIDRSEDQDRQIVNRSKVQHEELGVFSPTTSCLASTARRTSFLSRRHRRRHDRRGSVCWRRNGRASVGSLSRESRWGFGFRIRSNSFRCSMSGSKICQKDWLDKSTVSLKICFDFFLSFRLSYYLSSSTNNWFFFLMNFEECGCLKYKFIKQGGTSFSHVSVLQA